MKFQETKRRSIVKSITFRILVIISDLFVVYILTKQVVATVAITVFTNIASTVFYFLHERLWDGITWGRRTAK